MTKKQAIKKFRSMLPELKEAMIKDAEKLMDSGSINLSEYENSYLLPKILMSSILLRQKWQYMPFDKEGQKIAKKLVNC